MKCYKCGKELGSADTIHNICNDCYNNLLYDMSVPYQEENDIKQLSKYEIPYIYIKDGDERGIVQDILIKNGYTLILSPPTSNDVGVCISFVNEEYGYEILIEER